MAGGNALPAPQVQTHREAAVDRKRINRSKVMEQVKYTYIPGFPRCPLLWISLSPSSPRETPLLAVNTVRHSIPIEFVSAHDPGVPDRGNVEIL